MKLFHYPHGLRKAKIFTTWKKYTKYFSRPVSLKQRGLRKKENVIQLMNFLAWFGRPRLELQVSTRDHAEYIF